MSPDGSGTGTPVSGDSTPCAILDTSEYITYGFVTGTSQSTLLTTQAAIALTITEDAMQGLLGTALCPTEETERFTWPGYQIWRAGEHPIQLSKDRIISVDTVTTYHEDGCDCETTTYTGCSYIKDADAGIIEIRDDCWADDCAGCHCGCSGAFMTDITYTHGFTAAEMASTTSDGRTIRFWIAQWAQEVFNALQGLPSAVTTTGVLAWASMNYSERKAVVKDTMLGSSELANAMVKGLRRLNVKRAIKFGGRR